jgi:endonuclease/exonuclease/phosphatase family metal-dependent hydrolase
VEADGRSLVVATYNVHGFVGRDGARDPERVTRVLEELDADVVALQEVLSDPDEGPLRAMERRLGVRAVEGPTLAHHAGAFGNALLTRLPLRGVRRLDLSVPDREPRGAIDCTLETDAGLLRVVATHLGLRARERRVQVRRLTAELARPGAAMLVLLGDMNDWRSRVGPLATVRAMLGPSPRPRSFPAWRPALALDRIWARPASRLRHVRVHRTPLAREASDHLPVRGELRLTPAAGTTL